MASANSRRAAALIRNRARANREIRAAVKAVAAGPAPVSAHLVAGGVSPLTAHNYAGAITRKAKGLDRTPEEGTTVKKRKGKKGLTVARTGDLGRMKRHRVISVARWSREDLMAVALSGYRPKNAEIADFFARLALGRPAATRAAA
ncbi:hypothetical protein ACLQ16_03810 [Streptomyces albidoflavus]|uniref:hypothetical protein n=1 Tax=Streptomyces albidoflavus TaxID=1886 RepID=UPI000A1C89DF|nr:hypothetical protein [Streptomyces albidoflavus]